MGNLLPLLTHTDKLKGIKHLKAQPPQGHANVFVLIFISFCFCFFVEVKPFHALFITHTVSKIYLSALRTTKDKWRFHTHAVLSAERGVLFLLLFHIKWPICLFWQTTMHVYGALRNKNSRQLLHSGLPLFPASRLQSRAGASRRNGIFVHGPGSHGEARGAQKLILERLRSWRRVRRRSSH